MGFAGGLVPGRRRDFHTVDREQPGKTVGENSGDPRVELRIPPQHPEVRILRERGVILERPVQQRKGAGEIPLQKGAMALQIRGESGQRRRLPFSPGLPDQAERLLLPVKMEQQNNLSTPGRCFAAPVLSEDEPVGGPFQKMEGLVHFAPYGKVVGNG